MQIKKQHLIRSSRIAFAVLICFGVSEMFKINHPLWMLITLIVIMFDQSTVGGAVFRGFLRISATLAGATLGLLTLLVFHNNQLINDSIIILGTVTFAYLFMDSKYSYIGALGAVTLVMILANDYGPGDISVPAIRVITIVIGTCIAVISMLVFFPQYASTQIKEHIIDCLAKIETTLQISITSSDDTVRQHALDTESSLIGIINRFNRLSDEMHYETHAHRDYSKILLHIRRLNRMLNIIIHDINDETVRADEKLNLELSNLAMTFHEIRHSVEENTNPKAILRNLDYSHLNANPAAGYELIFIYSIVNRIINETRILIQDLEAADLLQSAV